MGLALVTAPIAEPVTLAELRAQCKLTDTTEDARLAGLMLNATEWAQGFCGRVFMPQTWDYTLDSFASEIELPIAPVQSITSITYKDAAGATQTLSASAYEVNLKSVVTRIRCADGYSWPDTARTYNAVTIRFVAGYAEGHRDMQRIKAAVLLHAEAHFDKDERLIQTLLRAAEASIWPLKITSF